MTFQQKYFLSLMAAEDLKEKNKFLAKFDALCRVNGVKIPESDDDTNSFRGQMLAKMKRNMED